MDMTIGGQTKKEKLSTAKQDNHHQIILPPSRKGALLPPVPHAQLCFASGCLGSARSAI